MTNKQAFLLILETLFGLTGLSLVSWATNGWAALGVFFCLWPQEIQDLARQVGALIAPLFQVSWPALTGGEK